MPLTEKIAQAIALKQGNTDFALWYTPDVAPGWSAGIGNDCPYVMLGEASPEIERSGVSAEAAVDKLIAALQEGSK